MQAVLRWVEGDPEGKSQQEVQQLLGAVRLPVQALAASLAAVSPSEVRCSRSLLPVALVSVTLMHCFIPARGSILPSC